MRMRVAISTWVRVLTCFAFALALVLSPPSAAHAASGMHDGQHSGSISSLLSKRTVGQGTDIHAVHMKHPATVDVDDISSDMGETEHQSTQCCNGICISVVIPDADLVFPDPIAAKEYMILSGQTHSVETSGFLRPPRFLI